MNGAENLLRTLAAHGVRACFANPGTTEMHLLGAIDKVTEIQPVLTLFEGVASGAADAYSRMTRTPAMTLFHLGPGFANAIANLHNARRARSPIINVIGDQATYHRPYDVGLTSNIESLAAPVSKWVRYCGSPAEISSDAAEAYAAALQDPYGSSTLVVPTDTSWSEAPDPSARREVDSPATVAPEAIRDVAKILRGKEPAALLVAGDFVSAEVAALCSQIGAVTGAKVFSELFIGRAERGAGRASLERLPYFPEDLIEVLKGIRHLILVGTNEPISFFAYPESRSEVKDPDCQLHTLATPAEDRVGALQALADELGAKPENAVLVPLNRPELRTSGPLDPDSVGAIVAHYLPEGAIVSEEAATSGPPAALHTEGCPAHDWIGLTGGAIGQGLPAALGAATACPDRKVISLQADGSSMYTIQALWSMAREQSDVTAVIYSNRSYAILRMELARSGIPAPSDRISNLVDLNNPELDFVSLARGLGVEADRATSVADFSRLFSSAMEKKGPRLIEALVDMPEQLATGG